MENRNPSIDSAVQRVVIDQPYVFIPPRFSRVWHGLLRLLLPRMLRKSYGITRIECIGAEKLRDSIQAGHSVMIVANHCRPCDPMVLDSLAAAVRTPFHVIASWHVFMTGWLHRFLLPRVGGFSIYREGMDRESLKCAVKILTRGKHPLVVFPEGIITRSNDRLVHFMEGPAFMARAAAKQRSDGKVRIHPVFIRYFFEGDLEKTARPVLEEIERRLSWQPQSQLTLTERISRIGDALLTLKEKEHGAQAGSGTFAERLQRLLDHLLIPLEHRWTKGRHDGDVMARAKRLRSAILPDMVAGNLTDAQKDERWRDLAIIYLIQQLHCYPCGYFDAPTPERILETIERFEEDLTDRARPHLPMRAVILVGDPVEVTAPSGGNREMDTTTPEIRKRLEHMMEESKTYRKTPS